MVESLASALTLKREFVAATVYRPTSFLKSKDDPSKTGQSSELSKHWSPHSTPARKEVIMKTTYPVNQESATKSVVIINK